MFTCTGFALGFAYLACAPVQGPAPAANYCDVAKPITWSAADTRATKAAADRENRKWTALCRPQGGN